MRIPSFLFVAFTAALLSCNDPPSAPVRTTPLIIPQLTLLDPSFIYWCRDSLFEDLIYPAVAHYSPDNPVLLIGALDYTCTILPDTCYGIAVFQIADPDTLTCFGDTCWIRGDTAAYDMRSYREKLANALCSESAVAYTQIGLSYRLPPGEDSVRLFNSCFDTVFRGVQEALLPKIPLDSLNGVWFASKDTFFCSAEFINTHDDYFTRKDVNNH
jgi:hypothetical protein